MARHCPQSLDVLPGVSDRCFLRATTVHTTSSDGGHVTSKVTSAITASLDRFIFGDSFWPCTNKLVLASTPKFREAEGGYILERLENEYEKPFETDFGSYQWEGWRAERCQGYLVVRLGCHPQRPSCLMILRADFGTSEYHSLEMTKCARF